MMGARVAGPIGTVVFVVLILARIRVEEHRLPRGSLRGSLIVFSAYLALTLAWGHLFIGSLATHFAHDNGDPLLNSWIMWWNATGSRSRRDGGRPGVLSGYRCHCLH